MDFLLYLLQNGLEYSAVNVARSALSAVLGLYDNVVFGKHPLVVRFMKGVFNQHPPQARYSCTWDVAEVLPWLRTLSPVKFISLKDLTFKLVMLLALVSAQRCQTLHALDLNCLSKGKVYIFSFTETLKHSRQGRPAPSVKLEPYPPDRRLCVITVLKEYIKRTSLLRGAETRLLISYIKPHGRVGRPTIARWVRLGLSRAGVDSKVYKAHSTRMASTSKALDASVPLTNIMAAAGWANAGTFAKFYHRSTKKSFQSGVLQS